MKQSMLILTIGTLLLLNSGCSKTKSDDINISVIENQATIRFENDILDFHTINEGEKVTGSFKFRNTGKNDLVISDVSANCGCTIADYPRSAVAPGDEGVISVTYDSKGSRGMKVQKLITVLSNTNPSRNVLKIVADVK
ncbi:MAG: DUF1573 domain-containing protein [Bacteroidales bacterium]